jgi:hypothetical protein
MSNPSIAKKITYIGEHPRLVDGGQYTVKELTLITGMTDNLLRYRLNDSNTCTDYDLRKSGGKKTNKQVKKPHTLTTSQKWLGRPII